MSKCPVIAAYSRAVQKDWNSLIEVQVTYREGGTWVWRQIRRAQLIQWINDANRSIKVQLHAKDWCVREYQYPYVAHKFCKTRVFAVRFESGAIYDFLLATSLDKAIRSQAWR